MGTKVTFPDKRNVGISYCRLLLHDTLLREDAFRTGTSDTPICECGLDMESAEHFLLHCTRHLLAMAGMSYNFLYKKLRIHQHVQVVCIYQKVFCWHQDGIMLLKIRINI